MMVATSGRMPAENGGFGNPPRAVNAESGSESGGLPNPPLAVKAESGLTCGGLAAAGLLLTWFSLVPLLIAGLKGLALGSVSPAAADLISLLLLAGLLLVPAACALVWARRAGRRSMVLLSLSLLLTAVYAVAAVGIRALAGEAKAVEVALNLGGLSLLSAGAGLWALPVAGIPRREAAAAFGFHAPSLAGLALGLGLVTLLTLGWPITGALGDSWASLGLLFESLAQALPAEIMFRGVILGLLMHGREQRKGWATTLSLLIYLAFLPAQVLPGGNWEAMGMIFVLLPMAALSIQLRYLTGSIWAGALAAWLYRAAPLLFTDPRDEIPEPSQWLAGGAMVLVAALLALMVWIVRRPAVPRWRMPRTATALLAVLLAAVLWAGWAGAWALAGEPGFHDDGFLIVMEEQADLSAAYDLGDPTQRRAYVYRTLVETAEETQAPVRARLDELGYSYETYYLINMIQVDGYHRHRDKFGELPGVAYVMVNPNVRPYPSHTSLGMVPAPEGEGVEWNIRRVNADDVWGRGYRGQGVVVGGEDTGYDWNHPALRERYRGWNAGPGGADHNYNWHDAWENTAAPHDDGDHGTHTMGTVLGREGEANQIGMAPEAEWFGCRNMRRGIGNPASYVECTEFLLAPYPLDGDSFHDGDVSRGADVVNNSWGCPDFEGCEDDTLKPALDAMRAAGIMMVVSVGNDGPACQTANEPPARYDSAFSVGATDQAGTVTFFSSRGPVPGAGEEEPLKPDVVAPGSEVRSSVPGGGYGIAGGTSMAGPHVTGLAALLWSARPELIGDIEATEEIIRQTARSNEVSAACPVDPQPPADDLFAEIAAAVDAQVCACGGVMGVPNNVYGWGEIDALRALERALETQ